MAGTTTRRKGLPCSLPFSIRRPTSAPARWISTAVAFDSREKRVGRGALVATDDAPHDLVGSVSRSSFLYVHNPEVRIERRGQMRMAEQRLNDLPRFRDALLDQRVVGPKSIGMA